LLLFLRANNLVKHIVHLWLTKIKTRLLNQFKETKMPAWQRQQAFKDNPISRILCANLVQTAPIKSPKT